MQKKTVTETPCNDRRHIDIWEERLEKFESFCETNETISCRILHARMKEKPTTHMWNAPRLSPIVKPLHLFNKTITYAAE